MNIKCCIIRVPKVLFRILNTLKNEIDKFIIRFCLYLNMKNGIQIIDYYFHVKIDFYFKFLMLLFVFQFHKKWETRYSFFSFFIFMMELQNELLKQIKINFMIIFTSMIYTLFKSKFVSSPLRFSAVQQSRGHQVSSA